MTQSIFVQFSDSTEATIIAVFSEPQDETIYPNQGALESSDPRYSTWYSALQKLPPGLMSQGSLVAPGD